MASGQSELFLKNAKFKSVKVSKEFVKGGAMSIENSRLWMTNSRFEKISALNGAVVYSDLKISFNEAQA